MAMVCAMTLAGCASPKTASTASGGKSSQQEGTASVDLLLVEASRQLINHRDPAQALAMAQLAAKRAPERIDVAWLQLQICAAAPTCQPEPLEARLRKLDPANGAVWLGPLARASKRDDHASEDQILEAMARSERIDTYWNTLVAKLAVALAQRTRTLAPDSKTPQSDALNETVRLLSHIAMQTFQPLADSCSTLRVADRLVAARCLLVEATLQRGDTYIAESIGLGIAQRLAAGDGAETSKVDQRIAVSRYQRETAGEIITAQIERERFATQQLELMRKSRREQDVFLAIIRWAGRPLTPPPSR